MYTALHILPAAPVCLVTSLCPIIWSANILASVGLRGTSDRILDLWKLEKSCLRVDDSDTSFQAIVEGALAATASKHLGLDDHVISTCTHQQSSCRVIRECVYRCASLCSLPRPQSGQPRPLVRQSHTTNRKLHLVISSDVDIRS